MSSRKRSTVNANTISAFQRLGSNYDGATLLSRNRNGGQLSRRLYSYSTYRVAESVSSTNHPAASA